MNPKYFKLLYFREPYYFFPGIASGKLSLVFSEVTRFYPGSEISIADLHRQKY